MGQLQRAKLRAEDIIDTVRGGLVVLVGDLRVESANAPFYQLFEVKPEETERRLIYELGNGQWDIPELRVLLEEILPESEVMNDYEVEHDFETIGPRMMLLNARHLRREHLILLAIQDITERKRTERLQEEQARLLGLIASGVPLEECLSSLCASVPKLSPGTRASILLADEERQSFQRPIAPDLLPSWGEGLEGAPINELLIGTCGEAVFSGKSITCEDVTTDDRWSKEWRDLCAANGVMAGYSAPIRGEDGDPQGSLMLCFDEPRAPNAWEDRLAGFGTHVASIAIERDRSSKALRDINETLEERVAERTGQVRALASKLTMAEQAERRRVSQLLHDDLQQRLYGIQLKMSFVRRGAEASEQAQLVEHAEEARDWINTAIETARRLTVDLTPPVHEGEGLADALGWLVTQMKEMHHFTVDLRAEQAFHFPDESMQVLLFQAVRELLFNVVKHAETDRAVVELREEDANLVIRVIDEGGGFDVEQATAEHEHDSGFGLFSVRERLGLFGGQMDIASAPGQGTEVTLRVPLARDEA